jgi:hypothetical protein
MIKVLVVPSDKAGVGYHRSISGHVYLNKKYGDLFKVDITYDFNINNIDFIKQYDIIHYHRTLGSYEDMENTLKTLDDLGIVTIMDIDDYWEPSKEHPAYHSIKMNNIDKKILNNIKIARNVTTTTDIFKEEIEKYNKNVFVIPNAVDDEEKQFISNPVESDKIRIGWLGGSCYDEDTEVLTNYGWMKFKDLMGHEKVATLDKESGNIEYQTPVRFIKEDYNGVLNVGRNNYIDYRVTPNHNMFVCLRGEKEFKLIESEKVHKKSLRFKTTGNWEGDEYEKFPFLTFGDRNEKFEMDDMMILYGFFLWCGEFKKINDDKCIKFEDKTNHIHLKRIIKKYFDSDIPVIFEPKVVRFFEEINNKNKRIPRDFLNIFSKKHLEKILYGYKIACGDVIKDVDNLYTKESRLADDFQELLFKLGEHTIKSKKKEKIDGLLYYKLISVKNDKDYVTLKPSQQKEVEYNGKIYCVEVPNHILYVRRNGKPYWCGNSHLKDLEILNGVVSKFRKEGLLDKVQFVLCGFDTRGYITFLDKKTGKQHKRKIKPEESVWYKYEKIFTDNYSTVSDRYKKFLMEFKNEEYDDVDNEPYRRVWTKPITRYAENYNLFDISLAPLVENKFNKMKSQLKVIEAGVHKKALVAQNFGPYTIDIINGFVKSNNKKMQSYYSDEGNGILIDTSKNHKDWFRHLKYLVENKDYINILGENLYKTVKGKYTLDSVTDIRKDYYIKLYEKNKK